MPEEILLHKEQMAPYERMVFESYMTKTSVDLKACFLDLVCHHNKLLQRAERAISMRTQNELNLRKYIMKQE